MQASLFKPFSPYLSASEIKDCIGNSRSISVAWPTKGRDGGSGIGIISEVSSLVLVSVPVKLRIEGHSKAILEVKSP